MMRTGLPDQDDSQPLGAPIRQPEPTANDEGAWVPVRGSQGIERNSITGRMRTNIAPPPLDIAIGITP